MNNSSNKCICKQCRIKIKFSNKTTNSIIKESTVLSSESNQAAAQFSTTIHQAQFSIKVALSLCSSSTQTSNS